PARAPTCLLGAGQWCVASFGHPAPARLARPPGAPGQGADELMAAVPETIEGNRLPDLALDEQPPLREPPPRSIRESLRELGGSKDLLRRLVRRDLQTKHAGSFFGFFWSLLTPVLTVLVYATVFYVMGFTPVGGEFHGFPFRSEEHTSE